MDAVNSTLTQLIEAFPRDFGFYHLGRVELQNPDEFAVNEREDQSAIAFRIYGDLEAWVVILFEKNLDISTYSELGNILVSKIATHLNLNNGLDVLVEPPRMIVPSQFEGALRNSNTAVRKSYAHFHKNLIIPIDTWVLPAASDQFGHKSGGKLGHA